MLRGAEGSQDGFTFGSAPGQQREDRVAQECSLAAAGAAQDRQQPPIERHFERKGAHTRWG